ncbi:hypothetical protein TWF718_002122 [Orbilia javanica]|uniref:Uncharacterized protein n=1 Tax=Orbilia javanica TaxID=47235 RepID=A0AAN8MQ37_9PEZI
MSNPKVYTMPVPVYVQAPFPGAPVPHIIPPPPQTTNPRPGYIWGYTAPQTATVMQVPGSDGTYGWPIYFQGGTSSNPQFAYYPVPPSAVPAGAVPAGAFPPVSGFPGIVPQGTSAKKHHRRRSKESSDDDDEKCTCHECNQGKGKGKGPAKTVPSGPPQDASHPHTGAFMPTQFFVQPPATTQQTTTFIPYVVPTGCTNHHCSPKTTGSTGECSTGHKHEKKASTSSYHYAKNCDCPTCKARRMAIEMERIQEERKQERELKDTQEFIKIKKRVDREEREATLEGMYRAKKAGGKGVAFEEPHTCHQSHPEFEGEYEWVAIPTGPVPITAFHPGGTTPITLQPLHTGSGPCMSGLVEENSRLRQEKGHLKEKIRRERSMRNKDDAARAFLSTRLHDLDRDVQELKKKTRKTQGEAPGKAPVVEIQVPLVNEGHNHHKRSASKDKNKGKGKGKGHAGDGRKDPGDHGKGKAKSVDSKSQHPHVCYDSDCEYFDSCSECSFECSVKGCRICRPRGGRR